MLLSWINGVLISGGPFVFVALVFTYRACAKFVCCYVRAFKCYYLVTHVLGDLVSDSGKNIQQGMDRDDHTT